MTSDSSTTSTATRAAGTARGRSAIASGATWDAAVDEALRDLAGGEPPDLAILFVDAAFASNYADVLRRVQDRIAPAHLIGCSGQSVIGTALEAEGSSAVTLMTFDLPGAALTPIRIDPETDLDRLDVLDGAVTTWLLFADPFSINTEHLVAALAERHPDVTLLGGMASAPNNAEGIAVFLDSESYPAGAVMLGVDGVEVHAIVAQGAEPLGQPWTITACENNIVRTIGSRPAVEVLVETLDALDEPTRLRAQQNLLVGLAMDEYAESHQRGSYLIRNIMGANRDEGWIAINAVPRLGQTFQFQFRDAEAADADLRERLSQFIASRDADQVLGAICCSCNGRGVGLFETPHHDAAALVDALGEIPTAGFFCNGEIGPVGGQNFLHGFTASIALFTAPAADG